MNRTELTKHCKALAKKGVWCIPEAALWALSGYPDKKYLRVALNRHVKSGWIEKIAPKLYLNPHCDAPMNAAYRLANFLRPHDTFYMSLESVLHESDWISQIPSCLTFITNGRSYVFETRFGRIQFVHTEEDPLLWKEHLSYVPDRQVWEASPEKALEDLKRYGKNLDLVIPAEERE
ncbi:hypothetical protein P5704_027415 (plasmid) [Pseudomonas sp. FeN3W]|nr:hypothetical protein P5704_027415 [Pseudomonas sp. FeN3W]